MVRHGVTDPPLSHATSVPSVAVEAPGAGSGAGGGWLLRGSHGGRVGAGEGTAAASARQNGTVDHDRTAQDLPGRDLPADEPEGREPAVPDPAGAGPTPAAGSLDEAERNERAAALRELIDMMRPAVQADGGDLQLVDFDVEAGTVEVQLVGACSSCAISSATLQGGVERILKGRLPWVVEVAGGVDESADPFESAALGQGGYVPRF